MTFGFQELSYTVSEGDGIVKVCTVITDVPAGGIGSDITLFFTFIEGIFAGSYYSRVYHATVFLRLLY